MQGELERAIATLVGAPVRVTGAGRTDAGVHALGQVASFTTESRLTPSEWPRALNAHLPPSIAVLSVRDAPEGFNARYDAHSRAYRYTILNRATRPALDQHRAWHVARPLRIDAMAEAAEILVGDHDFASFAGASADRAPSPTTTRTILAATCRAHADRVHFDVEANAFLPHMVRNLIGTLVLVGRGQLDCNGFRAILESRDRRRAAATAPPHGLYLVRVNYGGFTI